MKKAIWEATKFFLRNLLLVGVPTALAAVADWKPEYGAVIGIVLSIFDKFVHEAPVKAKGLMPF